MTGLVVLAAFLVGVAARIIGDTYSAGVRRP